MPKHSVKRGKSWLSLAIGSALLSGCATASFKTTCPPLPEYSKEEQNRAADEIEQHGDKVPTLVNWTDDYGRVRLACRAIE